MSVVALSKADAETDELPVLIPWRDLKGWTEDAVDLVLEYQVHGWSGRMSSRGHAIMLAPDGDGTASISRKHTWNRGGKNARRQLQRWLERKKAEARDQAKVQVNSFGISHEHLHSNDGETEPPWRIAEHQSYEARQRMRKILDSWWKSITSSPDKVAWQLLEGEDDDWALVAAKEPDGLLRMVATGPNAHPGKVAHLLSEMEQLNKNMETPQMTDPGPQVETKKYPCPEPGCDRSFDTQGALNLHGSKHSTKTYDCPLCEDRKLPTPAALGRHLHSSLHAGDPRLSAYLKMSKPRRGVKAKAKPKPKVKMNERPCEYCGVMMPLLSIGGHHRGHAKLGHIKIADGGDGATQVLPHAKATTAPETPRPFLRAVTDTSERPGPLLVGAAPVTALEQAPVVNGTGRQETPQELLNMVRALVNPDMVGDLERERAKCAQLEAELASVTSERNDLQAKLDLLKEAMNA